MRLRDAVVTLVAGALFWQPVACKCSEDTPAEKTGVTAQPESAPKRKPRPKKRKPSMETRAVTVDGAERRYLVRRPRGSKNRAAPVILFLHDVGGSAKDFARRRDLISGAAKLGYLMVVPSAGKDGWGPGLCPAASGPAESRAEGAAATGATQTSATAAKTGATAAKTGATAAKTGATATKTGAATAKTAGPAAESKGATGPSTLTDVRYVQAILDDLEKKYRADSKHVYVVAMGAAAAFAQQLVSELPGRIAGVALANAPSDCPKPGVVKPAKQPVPTLILTEPAQPPGTPSGLNYWLSANGCVRTPAAGQADKAETEYTCNKGRVVSLRSGDELRKWPTKIGKVFSIRYLHNFFSG